MKRIFLFLILLLLALVSVSALEIGETTIIDVDGDGIDDFAITFNGLDEQGNLDLKVTEYVDSEVEGLAVGQTTKTDDGDCFYTTFNALNGDGTKDLIVTACESEPGDAGDIEIVYADDGSCFIVTYNEFGDETILNLDSCPQEEQKPFFMKSGDGTCFKVVVTNTIPLTFEIDEGDGCETEEPQPPIPFLEDGVCFEVGIESTDPIELLVGETELSNCGIEVINHFIEDNTCFKVETMSLNPLVLDVDDVAMTECAGVVVTTTNDNQGTSVKKDDSDSTSSSPGGSMIGVPLNIPESNPLFNAIICKQNLNKQKCIDGYKTYNCESYNRQGKFKKYTIACASCDNDKKDHNENGVDCGGVCPACPVSGKGTKDIDLKAGVDKVVSLIPGSLWKWLIPLLVLILITGLIIGLILVWHNKEKNYVPVAAIKEESDVLKGIPLEKVSMMRQFIKIELSKGLERDAITSKLTGAGWKKPVVDHVFEEMQHHVMPSQYEEQLRRYIAFYIHKGIHKDKIKDNLISAGWKAEAVEKVMRKDF